uniref:Uncharacterized protein n=1 Tax=Chromera velia CCMP2878 TaxID=1169474 RepID=A0A0G4HX98_9ALVE|eukprot:Cvel_33088.t1-p1 / transcript=Cvel_33088.t1 / gene=Cvel_33088 / organism=Chromera_velia_CCMP2878 / gene_product=Retrovirus-related Pol polyprotein from transposon, putative / transcript_product=Retrovirus-related Pol polyprotein from transposon, putative / location=Cvel_scaffold5283:254-2242(-) / protein_length=163 / sequence_SO=supercontig / SO=protein_coding / is_pseudo=false
MALRALLLASHTRMKGLPLEFHIFPSEVIQRGGDSSAVEDSFQVLQVGDKVGAGREDVVHEQERGRPDQSSEESLDGGLQQSRPTLNAKRESAELSPLVRCTQRHGREREVWWKSEREESLIESFDMDFSTICECRVLWQGELKRGCPERQRHLHLLKTVHLG